MAHDEIDIAAMDPDGENLILGECKFWKEPVGVSVLQTWKTSLSVWNGRKQLVMCGMCSLAPRDLQRS